MASYSLFSGFLLLLFSSNLFPLATGTPLSFPNWHRDVGPHAQCMTHISHTDKAEIEQGLLSVRSDLAERDVAPEKYTFNVAFTVVSRNDSAAGGFINDSRIEAQMKVLNADYAASGISFVLVNTTRVLNADWFNGSYPGSDQEQAMKQAHQNGDATTLNIYTLTFNSTTKSLGTASVPSAYYRDPTSDGVMIRHSTITGGSRKNFNMGRTLTHEVGHWLGLLHTFEGGCDLKGKGDNVADTPPAASGSEGCPKGRDSCPGDGPDLINNFMDYSYDSCMDSFTKGQIVRMREAIKAFRRPGSKTAPLKPKVDVKAKTAGTGEAGV